MTPLERAAESLLGLSVGDSFGQCFLALPADQERRALEETSLPAAPWYYTDDTEMALSIVETLRRTGRIDQDALAARFAENYSYDRAYGPAMHRALTRIREGESWRVVAGSLFSGQGSFGNGSAMRVAPVGAYFADDMRALKENAAQSSEVTHSHPEAIAGATAVAVAASVASRLRCGARMLSHREFLDEVLAEVPVSDVSFRLEKARRMSSVASIQFPASVLGAGTQMSAQDTVPFALWCAAQSLDDFERALWLGVQGSVDKDTVCAIIGGVVSCYVGAQGIPAEWLRRREPLPDEWT